MNGTVPTLVVPMLETTGPESDSRYRSLRDTIVSASAFSFAWKGIYCSDYHPRRPSRNHLLILADHLRLPRHCSRISHSEHNFREARACSCPSHHRR